MSKIKSPKMDHQIEFDLGEIDNHINFKIESLKFKNEKQKEFFDLCKSDDSKLVICDGPAGTGKSLLAIYAALKQIKAKKFEKLLYIRSPVDASDTGLGYLPGDYQSKTHFYMLPLEEKLSKLLNPADIKKLIQKEVIESTVNTFMRGRSINDTIVVIDEVANFSMREILLLFSRFEENTKIIAIGDHMQSDIGLKSCLTKIMLMFDNQEAMDNGVNTFKFSNEDIVRSGLTKYIIGVFEKHNKISRGN